MNPELTAKFVSELPETALADSCLAEAGHALSNQVQSLLPINLPARAISGMVDRSNGPTGTLGGVMDNAVRSLQVLRGTAHSISQLSNASFESVRKTGLARVVLDHDLEEFSIANFGRGNFQGIESGFDQFLQRMRDVSYGINPKRRLQEALEVYDQSVIPALRASDVDLVNIRNYENSHLKVEKNWDLKKKFQVSSGSTVDLGTEAGLQTFLAQDQGTDLYKALDQAVGGRVADLPQISNWRDVIAGAAVREPRLRGLLDRTHAIDGAIVPSAQFTISMPLNAGWGRFLNPNYHAHARFEETMHLLQYANERPLTKMGLKVEEAIGEGDPRLLQLLKKKWSGLSGQRPFVRENDMTGIYRETGIDPPGLFYFMYDRRPVADYIGLKL